MPPLAPPCSRAASRAARLALGLATGLALAGGCTGPRTPGGSVAPTARPEHRSIDVAAIPEAARLAADSALRRLDSIPPGTFEAHEFQSAGLPRLAWRLLRPDAGARGGAGRTWPLVVLFHGSGEIGTDNLKHVDRFARAWARPELRRDYPAFVVAPQMPERSANYVGELQSAERRAVEARPMDAALALVDSLVRALPVDPARVYAIGFSMGGSTTWNAVARRPDRFAAAVVYGGVPTSLPHPADLPPLWLVHGTRDEANPIAPTRAVFEQMRARGARVRFWEYEGLGHVVPPELLTGSDVAAWLFAHRRGVR